MFNTMQDEPLSLARLLMHAGEAHGASTVATWTGTEARRRSYNDMAERASQLAHALRGLGVGPFDRVATFMWNNNEHMEVYTAVPAMGAVLHALNIRLVPEQLTFIANHAEDQVVFVDGSLVDSFASLPPQLSTVRHVVVNGDAASLDAPTGVVVHAYEKLLAGERTSFDFPVLDERSAAAMCYTSGTTGNPKGVVYSHRSLYLHAMQVTTPSALSLSTKDACLVIVPMFHVNAWSLPYAALVSGASLLMPDRLLQAKPLLAFMAAERPTCAAAVPTVWSGVLDHLQEHPQDISHPREVVVGGSAVPPALMKSFEERHGVKILHGWGMTETSSLGSVAHPPAWAEGESAWAYRVTQGQFPGLVGHRLVDDNGRVVPRRRIARRVAGAGPLGHRVLLGAQADPSHFDEGDRHCNVAGDEQPDVLGGEP